MTGRPRADAARNRAALLAAARVTFDAEGTDASLDRIAQTAGVGNATLYRNFPTRDELLVELMRENIQHLIDSGDELAAETTASAALGEWLCRLTWHLRTWHGMPARIIDALADDTSVVREACAPLRDRTAVFLAAATGGRDVDVDDVFELVTLLSFGVDRFGDSEDHARRRVMLAFTGILPDTIFP
ncbi:helix-turn-helix domain-containing protein [Herbiconiux sp. KACC 21604]|uniref:TetR/AcrR family transcriptional regulator n=1 Tax=unclassified Herbiconiux TaxID=2618217 RepID=UPI0014918CD1|nr:TetR/AcrR family transcriptional regulator [Herbiconiux sp. SALV-R1]QJU55295.1 helix-turn-helix transcriptional regulator [Herbiconiux sp. SALV-R1]WPO86462.1 helix-turn-helix domain-containing protein [Herbiconiux sp. KACC 21604]